MNVIRIKVENLSRRFFAVNLRVEVAIILPGGDTLHLDVDYPDFLMLPNQGINDATRIFIVNNFTPQAIVHIGEDAHLGAYISNPNNTLRIRIHSYHEFSGLGKAFQIMFPCPLPAYVHQPAPAPNP